VLLSGFVLLVHFAGGTPRQAEFPKETLGIVGENLHSVGAFL